MQRLISRLQSSQTLLTLNPAPSDATDPPETRWRSAAMFWRREEGPVASGLRRVRLGRPPAAAAKAVWRMKSSSIEDPAARERDTGEATEESTMWETLGDLDGARVPATEGDAGAERSPDPVEREREYLRRSQIDESMEDWVERSHLAKRRSLCVCACFCQAATDAPRSKERDRTSPITCGT